MPVSAWWDSLTVVVPTSPVPSNPSTEVLEAVFGSFGIVPRLVDAPKLVQLDGAQEELSEKRRKAYDLFEVSCSLPPCRAGRSLSLSLYLSLYFLRPSSPTSRSRHTTSVPFPLPFSQYLLKCGILLWT
eukprot:scaffold102724_cov29-Tisochrysis_lutea.AAC.4